MPEKELESKGMKDLFQAIAQLRNPQEVKNFMRDLCTFPELRAMEERFAVAKRVRDKQPYRAIAKETGSSTATITRVAHWLHHGMGGYQLVLDRMKA